jgi:uncharacterized protein involved in copper resistance
MIGRETMTGHTQRICALAVLAVGLAACSSGPAAPPRTSAPASQSGAMNPTGIDRSRMDQMAHDGGAAADSGSMVQMDHAQMMQHCRAMMAQPNQGGTPTTR